MQTVAIYRMLIVQEFLTASVLKLRQYATNVFFNSVDTNVQYQSHLLLVVSFKDQLEDLFLRTAETLYFRSNHKFPLAFFKTQTQSPYKSATRGTINVFNELLDGSAFMYVTVDSS